VPIPPITLISSLHFSGHETFPLRQLWLRKAFDAISSSSVGAPKSVFADENAIVRFGVGKNMVTAIKHWSLAAEFMEEDEQRGYRPTALATEIFRESGLDPFCEHPSTAWLVHWKLAGIGSRSTTWLWLFNCVVEQSFNKEGIVQALKHYCADRSYKVSNSTLVRDVDVCIASYAPRAVARGSREDAAEPLLGELSLIQPQMASRGSFVFRRGPKRTLTPALFAYVLIDFWNRKTDSTAVLSFEKIAYDYGSPGRVFKLDENSVGEFAVDIENTTHGALRWSDSSGIRQIHKTDRFLDSELSNRLLREAYE
jgi:hypothetical protein